MAGAALSRLWDTKPRIACALQSIAALLMGVGAVAMVLQHDWVIVLIVTAGFGIESATLVIFTREAIAHGWSQSSY